MYPASLLTPVDFSEPSLRAARFALSNARLHGATLSVLHVDHLPAFSTRMAERIPPDAWEEYLHERNVSLRQRLEELARSLGAEHVQTLLSRDDDIARAIVSRAADQSSQLIVMAPHGAGDAQRFLLGGVAFEVAANAPCPVLVTRLGAGRSLPEGGRFRRMLVAATDAPDESMRRLIAALAAPGASLDLLHVLESREPTVGPPLPERARALLLAQQAARREHLEHAASELGAAGVSARVQLESGDAASVLLKQIASSDSECVIVGARSIRRRAGVLGPVARRVLQHSPIPVAIVPPPTHYPERAP